MHFVDRLFNNQVINIPGIIKLVELAYLLPQLFSMPLFSLSYFEIHGIYCVGCNPPAGQKKPLKLIASIYDFVLPHYILSLLLFKTTEATLESRNPTTVCVYSL